MAETDTSPPPAGGTVHVPGIGPVKKKTATYAAVGGVALVLLYIIVRRRQNASAAATSPTTVTDSAGNVCAALAPSGFCPGTAEDIAAQQSASAGVFGPTGQQPGVSVSGDGTTPVTGPGTFANNAEWATYAEQRMGSDGADAIAAALGKYLAGAEVTADQVTIIDEARAIAENPPVIGPGGKPPSINQVGGPHPPPPAGKVTMPRVIGDRVENANSSLLALGLKTTFGPRKPGKPYHVTAQSPAAGARVNKGSTVHLTIAEGA
jgi:hypothetical protein